MRIEAKKYLFDIAHAAASAMSFASGKSFAEYESDAMLRSAVERQLEIVGEVLAQLARIDPATASSVSEYRRIIAFRNILIHGYAEIDQRIVWDVLNTKLPVVRSEAEALLVWACDRIARSTRHFLEVLDELNRLNVEFVSFREQIDTGGPLGRAIVVIIGAIAELERSLIVERVRSGMRRARLEGQHIGRPPLELDRAAILRDRQHGQSLGKLARTYSISRTTVYRVLHEHAEGRVA